VIPEGTCIPEAKGLLSNQSSGHNIECNGRRPTGLGWVLSGPTSITKGVLVGVFGVNPEEMRGY